jgi:hypothetical protein
MAERWLSFQELVALTKSRLPNASIGRCEAIVREARASEQVRSHPAPPAPVLLTTDDGVLDFNLRPGAINKATVSKHVPPDGKTSEDDFLDWLDRNHAPTVKRGKRSKRNNAAKAIEAIWGDVKVPDTVLDRDLCTKVHRWMASKGLRACSDETILRAAGRKLGGKSGN